MSSRHGLWVIAAAALVSAACGGVSERPGHDFAMRVLDESPITVVGQIYAPVRFAVDGCEKFDVSFEDGTGALHSLPYTPEADGTFQASVPVSWIRNVSPGLWESSFCAVEAQYTIPPFDGALLATCQDVGRSARAAFSVSIATATKAVALFGPVRAVFPGDDPLLPWDAVAYRSDGWVNFTPRHLTSTYPLIVDWEAFEVNPLVRPRFARNNDRAFVTLGCEPHATCPQSNERLADFSLADASLAPPRAIAHVPSSVIDIAYAADGSLVVLSQTGDLGEWNLGNTSTIVTRVEPAPEGSQGVAEDAVTVIAEIPRQSPLGRFARTATGELRFLTRAYPDGPGPIDAVLHSTDGHSVDEVMKMTVGRFYASGSISYGFVSLSPDGSSMVVDDGTSLSLVSTDPANPVRERLDYWGYEDGAVWMPGAIVVWYMTGGNVSFGTVSVYDSTPPHRLRWTYGVEPLPGAVAIPYLLNVTAVGDKLALTTSTGLRILGPDGALVGGSDPFPGAPAPTTTANAVTTGPTTVAVGAGDCMYVFDTATTASTR